MNDVSTGEGIICPTCKGNFPSHPEFTAHIGNPTCANGIVASPDASEFVRFVMGDPGGLWKEGEIAEDLGWESALPEGDPLFVPVRLLRLRNETLALTDPIARGIIERIAHDEAEEDAILDDVDSILPLVKELTAYQANVFLILNDGRAGLRFRDVAALNLIRRHRKLIVDRERRRFEPLATARAIVESEVQGRALGKVVRDFLIPGNEDTARAIIKRISDAAIELAFVRHSLTNDEFDETNYPDAADGVEAIKEFAEEIKTDTLNCLTGDDTGCLDESELDETNCELLWLQKTLGDMIPRSVFEPHTKAVAAFLSEMAEIYSLDALEPAPVTVKEVTEALLKVSREIRERMATISEDTARLDWLKSQSRGYGNGWIVRRRTEGGVALHESARDSATAVGPREAIDEAMKEGI